MKVAFAFWNGRIAPVFDVSRRVIIVEIVDGREIARFQASFANDNFQHKTGLLNGLGVQELVCGAISRDLAMTFTHGLIAIRSFIAGDIEEVISAFISGTLDDTRYCMPGCRGCCRKENVVHSAGRRRRVCLTEPEE